MLRLSLYNQKYNQLTIEVNDPIGINDLILSIKRSAENDGIFYEVIIDLKFIREAIPYIDNCFFYDGGIDAKVIVTVYEYEPNTRLWEVYQKGKINFNNYARDNDTLEVAIEQISAQSDVINGLNKEVELTDTVSVTLHSKVLLKRFIGRNSTDENVEFTVTGGNFGTIDFENILTDEIGGKVTVQPGLDVSPANVPMLIKVPYSGYYRIVLDATAELPGNIQMPSDLDIVVTANNGVFVPTIIVTNEGTNGIDGKTRYSCDEEEYIERGTGIYIYAHNTSGSTIVFNWIYSNPLTTNPVLLIEALTQDTTSTANGVLMFEAVEQCLQSVSDNEVYLRSDLLGRITLGYAADGDASFIVWTNGHAIRKTADKKIFGSLEKILEFLNAAFCVSFGFEEEAGITYFRVERKNYFYDKENKAVTLSGQYDFNTTLISSMYYNQFVFGYSSSIVLDTPIDDAHGLRKYSIPIKATKNILNVATEIKVAGSDIETLRRLRNSTVPTVLDDANFVICVRYSSGWLSKKDQGYSGGTGFQDFTTGYNYDILPSRMLQNWKEYLSAILVYSKSKIITFESGTLNYLASTTKTGEDQLFENGDVTLLHTEPLVELFNYTLTNVPLSRTQVDSIRDNQFGYFEFRNKDNVKHYGFIFKDGISHDSNKGTATIQLIKMFRP